MARNLILTGGIGHPFEDAAPALAAVCDDLGIHSEIRFDLEAALGNLAEGGFEVVTVYALRWRMLGSEKYAPHKAKWGFSLSERGRKSLKSHLERGGGLVGVHTASICFDDWPEWKDVLGGTWHWGRSFHPPRGVVHANPTRQPHPITAGLSKFVLANDEVYSALDLAPDVEPLLTASAPANPDNPPMPALWARQFGRGRVVYDALGHDRAAIEHPVHRRILRRSLLWVLRREASEIAAA